MRGAGCAAVGPLLLELDGVVHQRWLAIQCRLRSKPLTSRLRATLVVPSNRRGCGEYTAVGTLWAMVVCAVHGGAQGLKTL